MLLKLLDMQSAPSPHKSSGQKDGQLGVLVIRQLLLGFNIRATLRCIDTEAMLLGDPGTCSCPDRSDLRLLTHSGVKVKLVFVHQRI